MATQKFSVSFFCWPRDKAGACKCNFLKFGDKGKPAESTPFSFLGLTQSNLIFHVAMNC